MIKLIVNADTGDIEISATGKVNDVLTESVLAMNAIAATLNERFGVSYNIIYETTEKMQSEYGEVATKFQEEEAKEK